MYNMYISVLQLNWIQRNADGENDTFLRIVFKLEIIDTHI